MTTENPYNTPLMMATWDVLQGAKDAGCAEMVQVCYRLIALNRSGKLGSDEAKALKALVWEAA